MSVLFANVCAAKELEGQRASLSLGFQNKSLFEQVAAAVRRSKTNKNNDAVV
jgi:hypothetical protein